MVSIIKKIGFAVLFTALTVVIAQAQTAKKDKPKKHQCTEQCSNGRHIYKHGEKKHKCDASCNPTSTTIEMKDHVCTDACHSAGKCVMAHGEKGHTCDANCKKLK
ncbi:MAG TPA: hypothetical protein PK006_07685 [Saprospiraceae bacterium]|nr:hypothetical protein [Saprospiraceae bacterium]